jgi:hypothetical protein
MSQNNSGNPIFVLGQEYLLEFAQFLSHSISSFLSEKWGEDWFDHCVVKDGNVKIEDMSDLSFLLRQILDLNNHNFRFALGMSVFGTAQMQKPHLTALEQIRKSRNFWAHPNRFAKLYDLNRLAFNIQAIVPSSAPLAKKCATLLKTEETSGHLATIASMTEINRLYRNSSEYRGEIARSLKSFSDRISDFTSKSKFDPMYTAQNHMLRNLWFNWLYLQPLYYTLLWDSLIDKRDPRTGARYVSDSQLEELSRELDTANGLKMASDYSKALAEDIGIENCQCEFCKILGDQGPVLFKEEAHNKIENVYLAVDTGGDFKSHLDDKETIGIRPTHFLFIAVVCAARSNVSAEKILDEWSFDILNPLLTLNSDAFDNHDVLVAAIKLVAIRNGISPLEVEKWDLE